MNKKTGFEFSAALPGLPLKAALRCLTLALALVCISPASAMESVRPFAAGSFSQVLAARQGKPFILVLWSLDCQYCLTELKTLSELRHSHPQLDVVLVSTDTVGDGPQLVARTESYGLKKIEQWVFAEDVPERLRLEIDGRWYGEVPRTYFFDQRHQREAKSGLVNKKVFEDWLSRNMPSGSGH